MAENDQAEHQQVSTALEVEQIENNIFRSKCLWLPVRARGAFGGQVISQALVSATNCVDPAYGLHSMHCYFMLSASPAQPIIYFVERLREGRSYTTRSVKAVQNGKIIFMLLCSFHKPEPWQPQQQWPMPDAPQPDECEYEEVYYERSLRQKDWDARMRDILQSYINERSMSPIAVKPAGEGIIGKDGNITYMYWMQAKDIPKYEAPFQKCILAYLSDLHFITAGAKALGLKRWVKGPDGISMTSTLDHSIYFYDDEFDCGDWLLYVMVSPRAGAGRGVMHGRLYTRTGKLVAITTQEGVMRAQRTGPKL